MARNGIAAKANVRENSKKNNLGVKKTYSSQFLYAIVNHHQVERKRTDSFVGTSGIQSVQLYPSLDNESSTNQ